MAKWHLSRSIDGHKCWCFNRNGWLQIDQLILYNAAKQLIANLCETIKPWLCLNVSMTITMSIISALTAGSKSEKDKLRQRRVESQDCNRLMLKGRTIENDGKAKKPQLINGNYLIHLYFRIRDAGWRKRKGYNLIIISFFSLSSQLDWHTNDKIFSANFNWKFPSLNTF